MADIQEGITLFNQGLYEEALEQFQNVDIDPAEDSQLSYYLGLCFSRLDYYDQALIYLGRVLETDVHLLRIFQARLIISFIKNKQGDCAAAEYYLNKSLEEGYESVQVFSGLGYACWKQGHFNEAVTHYRKALELDPENANALNSLGYILADSGDSLREAEEYCQKALSLDPYNFNYMDSVGWVYFRMGELEKAQDFLSRAVQEGGIDSDEIKSHLKKVLEYV